MREQSEIHPSPLASGIPGMQDGLKPGTLYVVATPIGNLSDLSPRALAVLAAVDAIACEDTRHTRPLLSAFGLRGELVSVRSQNERSASTDIIDRLRRGQTVAYVSDAGSPGVSDPGAVLVAAVREAGYGVSPLPGPSALATLLSVSGLSGKRVVFEGFLSPRAGRRRRTLAELLAFADLVVVYESPFRIAALARDLASLDPEARVVLGRELTKLHEEIWQGSATELCQKYPEGSTAKGEFSLVFASSRLRNLPLPADDTNGWGEEEG